MELKRRCEGLVAALALPRAGSLVSIVGGGGKSALLFALAQMLPGRVVTTTTTRIFASQQQRAAEVCGSDPQELEPALGRGVSGLLVIGAVEGEKAKGVERALPARWLAHRAVDHVVVEADGSRMRPIKAPAEHEPVIPDESGLVVVVVGIDALSAPISEIAHRPERVSALTGVPEESTLDPAAIGRLLGHPAGGLQGVPPSARVAVMVNKVETPEQHELASRIAAAALESGRIERVLAGALEGPDGDAWTLYERDA